MSRTYKTKDKVDVHLVDVGNDPVEVIDALGHIKSNPSFNEAVDLVKGPMSTSAWNSPPAVVLAGVNMSEAESAVYELNEAGAVAEIKPSSN